jgi:hypothetical protein
MVERIKVEVREMLKNEVLPRVKDMLDERNKIRLGIARLEENAFLYEKEGMRLRGTEIPRLKREVSSALESGESPEEPTGAVKSAEERAKECEGWVQELRNKAIPDARRRLGEADAALWKLAWSETAIALQGGLLKFDASIREASAYLSGWPRAVYDFLSEDLDAQSLDPEHTRMFLNSFRRMEARGVQLLNLWAGVVKGEESFVREKTKEACVVMRPASAQDETGA